MGFPLLTCWSTRGPLSIWIYLSHWVAIACAGNA